MEIIQLLTLVVFALLGAVLMLRLGPKIEEFARRRRVRQALRVRK